ncbi:hypothetical protein HZ326_30683 [Fusarium oxysporum f. sp. albedinis]|nr:hypothetical protein HZ326_30683 [Fusarium oxysporum f. sp. albedinis]
MNGISYTHCLHRANQHAKLFTAPNCLVPDHPESPTILVWFSPVQKPRLTLFDRPASRPVSSSFQHPTFSS